VYFTGSREAEKERATERQNILREKEAARRLLTRLQVTGGSSPGSW